MSSSPTEELVLSEDLDELLPLLEDFDWLDLEDLEVLASGEELEVESEEWELLLLLLV